MNLAKHKHLKLKLTVPVYLKKYMRNKLRYKDAGELLRSYHFTFAELLQQIAINAPEEYSKIIQGFDCNKEGANFTVYYPEKGSAKLPYEEIHLTKKMETAYVAALKSLFENDLSMFVYANTQTMNKKAAILLFLNELEITEDELPFENAKKFVQRKNIRKNLLYSVPEKGHHK